MDSNSRGERVPSGDEENVPPEDRQFEAWTPVFAWREGEPYVIGFMRGTMYQHPRTVKSTAVFVPNAPALTEGCPHLEGVYFTLSNQLLVAKDEMTVHSPFVDCGQLQVSAEDLARFVSAVPPEDKRRAGASTTARTEGPRGSVWLQVKRPCGRAREQGDTTRRPTTVAPEVEEKDAEDDTTDSGEDTEEEPVPPKRRKKQEKVCWSPRYMHRC